MKRLWGILGGLSLMAITSSAALVMGCTDRKDYTFELKRPSGDIVDIFDKREVEDYFFGYNSGTPQPVTEVFIKFKNQDNVKAYGQLSGGLQYWLKQLYNALGYAPAQEKYADFNEWIEPIPDWAWKSIGRWDYDKNEPIK